MDKKLIIKTIWVWAAFIPLAVLNGVLRGIYEPYLGELAAHQASTFLAMAFFFFFVYLLMKKDLAVVKTGHLFLIGGLWLSLTILFEFIFGHYVIGHSWSRLLADYDLMAGRIWSLFLAFEFITPFLVSKSGSAINFKQLHF